MFSHSETRTVNASPRVKRAMEALLVLTDDQRYIIELGLALYEEEYETEDGEMLDAFDELKSALKNITELKRRREKRRSMFWKDR